MDKEITITKSAAAFSVVKSDMYDKSSYQTKIIVNMLHSAIENGVPLTKDDIVVAYKKYRFNGKEVIYDYDWDKSNQKWVRVAITFEKLRVYYPHARQWFKSNLGGAILKGKIIAIPVIEID